MSNVVKFRSRSALEMDRIFDKWARALGLKSFAELEQIVKAEKERRRAKRGKKAKKLAR